MRVSCLIVDDEPLARLRLRDLIGEVPWLACVGEAADAEQARSAVDRLQPDVVFLDVRLPGLPGTAVLDMCRHRPEVVFTTAYDRYAVTAFEQGALDYLLKPFGAERFRAAAARVRERLARGPSRIEPDRSAEDAGDGPAGASRPPPLTRLFVRHRGRIVPVAAASISRLEADGDYVAVHVEGRRYLVHVSLAELERRLGSGRFLRVHRRHVVNLDHVTGLRPRPDSRLDVELADGSRVVASRSRSKGLRGRVL